MSKGKCLTPESIFHIDLTNPRQISIIVNLPGELALTENEAKELEDLIHNGLEYAIAKFWHNIGKDGLRNGTRSK